MKVFWLILFLFLSFDKFTKTADFNQKSRLAAAAYQAGNFPEAVNNYEFLVNDLGSKDWKLLLNLAHSYYRNNDLDKAKKAYLNCIKSPDATLRSVAWEQLGTLETKIQNYMQALTFFKRALIANPQNEQARYNYELLKKYLNQNPEKQNQTPPPQKEEQKSGEQKQDKDKQQENPEEKDQQNQNKPSEEGREKEQDKPQPGDQQQKPEPQKETGKNKPENNSRPGGNSTEKEQKQGEETGNEEGVKQEDAETLPEKNNPDKKGGNQDITGNEKNMQTQYEKLRKMNISPEKAEMMLDAMRNAEMQYLQQLPKKATKKKDRSKPDW